MTDSQRPGPGSARPGGGGAVFGLGIIGAMVWYLQQANGFWQGVLGVLKSFVWPALLVYDAFKALHH